MSNQSKQAPDYSRRTGLIHHLEAHYRRFLARAVIDNCGRMLNPDNPVDEGSLSHPGKVRATLEFFLEIAREGEEAVAAARTCPDDLLDEFVRYKTSPDWRKLMEDAGLAYDERNWMWRPKDEVSPAWR